jgi:L-threonate 2-dehydrogenase
MPNNSSVGLIGFGLMGEVYASRLVAAGFSVAAYDVDPAKAERMAQIGVRAAALDDIARTCDPIVLAVFSTDQVEDVVEHMLLPAVAGKIVICTSTCDPDRIAALGARIGERLRFLEVPVSGTSAQVRAGDGLPPPPPPRPCSTHCSRAAHISARSATAAAPSWRSI